MTSEEHARYGIRADIAAWRCQQQGSISAMGRATSSTHAYQLALGPSDQVHASRHQGLTHCIRGGVLDRNHTCGAHRCPSPSAGEDHRCNGCCKNKTCQRKEVKNTVPAQRDNEANAQTATNDRRGGAHNKEKGTTRMWKQRGRRSEKPQA